MSLCVFITSYVSNTFNVFFHNNKFKDKAGIWVFGLNLYRTLGSGGKAWFSDAFCLKMSSEKNLYPAHYGKLLAMGKVMRINEENQKAS